MSTVDSQKRKIRFYKGSLDKQVDVEELRNTIAQCLQVENLNVLIGAGCSSFVVKSDKDGTLIEKAIPTMRILTRRFYDDFKKSNGKDFSLDNGKTAETIYPNNLEDVLNHLISFRNICEDDKKEQVNKKIEQINKFIFSQIKDGTKNQDIVALYKMFYSRIIHSNRRTPINIYTTNYDTYNESALDELKFIYNNGFSGGSRRVFNPNTYNYVLVENLNLSKSIWHNVTNFVNLFKIHGSITWVKEGQTIIEREIEIIENDEKFKSLMIYPTPEKDRSTLMTPYSDLFRIMQNNLLKKNSLLLCLGYSFGDEHINRIILNALSVYDFRIVIFGDSEKIAELKEIGDDRIWVINSEDKIQYFSNLINELLPRIDDEQNEINKLNENIVSLAAALKGEQNEK